jgi:PPM family protein phosphatase
MSDNTSTDTLPLFIQPDICFSIDPYHIEVIAYLGCFTPGIHSFEVKLSSTDTEPDASDDRLGLLRIGSVRSGLNRELKLREDLGAYGLIAPLLCHERVRSVAIAQTSQSIAFNLPSPIDDGERDETEYIAVEVDLTEAGNSQAENESEESDCEPKTSIARSQLEINDLTQAETSQIDGEINPDLEIALAGEDRTSDRSVIEPESEYLEEEYLEEKTIGFDPEQEQLIVLTALPESEYSLQQWLDRKPSQTESLSLANQLCQVCYSLMGKQWIIVNLIPRFVEFKKHLKLYDLTDVYILGETPSQGLTGEYYAPELKSASPIGELMSTYMIGALLYHSIHHRLPTIDEDFNLSIDPIPRLYQLLKISLSPVAEERFPLSQFRQLLLEARKEIDLPKIRWDIASNSTVGLALERLQNEDNFAIGQQQLSNNQTLVIAAVADGMGGMAQGEVASRIAVDTILGAAIPSQFKSPLERNNWQIELFQTANQAIGTAVNNGGTTLSLVMAINRDLTIAHVGDSRIYLIRQGKLEQLSQDHTYVSLLLNSGKITIEESKTHPDRNQLVKSLGSKNRLSNGYVQTLVETTKNPTLTLMDGDILLLCSDGVWDLVTNVEMETIFNSKKLLQVAVDSTIQKVIDRGASDNATLLALQIHVNHPLPESSVINIDS